MKIPCLLLIPLALCSCAESPKSPNSVSNIFQAEKVIRNIKITNGKIYPGGGINIHPGGGNHLPVSHFAARVTNNSVDIPFCCVKVRLIFRDNGAIVSNETVMLHSPIGGFPVGESRDTVVYEIFIPITWTTFEYTVVDIGDVGWETRYKREHK